MADCGLLNLASCLPERFFEYIAGLLNAPLQPLLTMVHELLSMQVDLSLFTGLWAIMVYILSLWYALLILYAGFNLMLSGYDAAKREHAKEWLRNTVIMIILIQASFFLYELAIQLASVMTVTTLTLISDNFFLITFDSVSNIALEIVFFALYIVTLLATSLILIIRYLIAALGVVLFPLAIFLYFISPLRSYGVLLLHFVGSAVFVTFLDAIALVGFSRLIDLSLFANIKILVVIASFCCINLLMLFLMFFSVLKAALTAVSQVKSVVTGIIG